MAPRAPSKAFCPNQWNSYDTLTSVAAVWTYMAPFSSAPSPLTLTVLFSRGNPLSDGDGVGMTEVWYDSQSQVSSIQTGFCPHRCLQLLPFSFISVSRTPKNTYTLIDFITGIIEKMKVLIWDSIYLMKLCLPRNSPFCGFSSYLYLPRKLDIISGGLMTDTAGHIFSPLRIPR